MDRFVKYQLQSEGFVFIEVDVPEARESCKKLNSRKLCSRCHERTAHLWPEISL